MKVKNFIKWLQEKNPEAEIFISEHDSLSYYELYGLESFLSGEKTGSEHTVLINFNKKKRGSKTNLFSKESILNIGSIERERENGRNKENNL